MFKQLLLSLCTLALLVSGISCGTLSPAWPELSGNAVIWNGHTLIHESYSELGNHGGNIADFAIPYDVLTTEEGVITVSFTGKLGSNESIYGTGVFLQVYLDNAWYTFPHTLSRGKALLSSDSPVIQTIDLSAIGNLSPGKYRLVGTILWERLRYEAYDYAYFWIIEPGEEYPPESDASGFARLGDIVFRVESLFEARRVITDRDIYLSMFIKNLSGKQYDVTSVTLETKRGGKWDNVVYQSANKGRILAKSTESQMLFLDGPLAAGEYRLRLSMHTEKGEGITPEYEFAVMPYEDAPKPAWDISRLELSRFPEASPDQGVQMLLTNPVLSQDNTNLEIIITANNNYFFGQDFSAEVWLNNNWYTIPLAFIWWTSEALVVDPAFARTHSCNPIARFGILPAGDYRLIKSLDWQIRRQAMA